MAKKKWMLFFTVEMDLEPEEYEEIGDVAEEIAGAHLTRELEAVTGNQTWKHMMSMQYASPWARRSSVKVPYQWDADIQRHVVKPVPEIQEAAAHLGDFFKWVCGEDEHDDLT